MTKKGAWSPLLEGRLAVQAWQAVRDVAAALEPAARRAAETDSRPAGGNASLASGSAGRALLYAYLALARPGHGYSDVAMACLDHATEALAASALPPGLYNGFAGLGWTEEHLAGRLFESDDDEAAVASEIDAAILGLLRQEAWRGEYDLISGLTGLGVYALERLPRPPAREMLELWVVQMARLAQDHPAGAAWWTPPQRLPADQRAASPHGYYNLGVAHGAPAVIAVLAATSAAGISTEPARPLLDRAVAWLLAQEQSGVGSCFSTWVGEGIAPRASRLAWCYGDLGVAAALLLAARCVAQPDWEREAVRVARLAARRPEASAGVLDTGLCHGAAGLGHLFNRLYQATGDEDLAAAARSWFRRTLVMRRSGEGIAGFLAWAPDRHKEMGWRSKEGFLGGATGIALALLGAVSSLEPQWDRVLLSSIRPSVGL